MAIDEQGLLTLARVLPHVRPLLFSSRTSFWEALKQRIGKRLGVNASWPDAISLIIAEDVEGAFSDIARPIRDELARMGFVRVDLSNTAWEIYHGDALIEGDPPYELVLPLPGGLLDNRAMFRDYEWKAREFLRELGHQRVVNAI